MSKVLEQGGPARAVLAWVVSAVLTTAACGGDEMSSQNALSAGSSSSTPGSAGHAGTAPSMTAAAGGPANAGAGTTGAAGAKPVVTAGSAAGGAGSSASGSGGMSGSTGGAAPGEPTFTNVYNALFSVAGVGGCYGCHGGLANPALNGNFAMLSDQATTYKALVSAMSSKDSVCKDMTRVTPGDPMKSLLYLKLSSMQACGMPMPPGTPLAADLVEMIKKWIAAGAKED